MTNGLAKAANKSILEGLKKRLDLVKGLWAKQLPSVLWSYRMTIHTDTKETPLRLTFGQDAVILMEIRQAKDRVLKYSEEANGRLRAKSLDFFKEDKELAHIRSMAYKGKVKKYFDKHV